MLCDGVLYDEVLSWHGLEESKSWQGVVDKRRGCGQDKGLWTRVGLVDEHKVMYGAVNARTTIGERGVYDSMN